MRFPRRLVVPAMLLCLVPSLARAGEVTVLATTLASNQFSPTTVTVNVGDHVVWQWVTNFHSCTSGATAGVPGPVGPPGNQIQWDTGPQNSGTVFNMKFQNPGSYQFFCGPHAPGMQGVVNVSATHVSVPDFRITEIVYGDNTNNFVEIANLGGSAGHLEGKLDINGNIVNLSFDMAAGSHAFANAGTFSAALGSSGYVALFLANTVNTNLDATQIIDYVEWGNGGHAHEADAVDAQPTAYWTGGDFLPTMAPNHSMSFCGNSGDYGMGFWSETATRTKFNPNACASPAHRSTWGRLKSLYR